MNMAMHVTKRRMSVVTLLLVLATCAFLLFGGQFFQKSVQYNCAAIVQGNVESTISSSGTLSPVTQVEVGTQVSGPIARVLVDFNDNVKKGQIIAVLDSTLLRVAVTDARSGVMRAEAQQEETEAAHSRSEKLFQKGLLSEAEYQTTKTARKNAQAALMSAQAALDRAELNLDYAIIRSPIDGTVTARNVEAGQTVAASFATPTLFTIAKDLSKMEIKALVDESDIGQIKDGQSVRFTVQAYPSKKFTGMVKQVRVQPTTNSNVVNYTVVISAENKENLLLPGMTAAVDFVIEQKKNVLLVPNSALRFQPSEAQLTSAKPMMPPPSASLHHGMPPPPDGTAADSLNGAERKTLWIQDVDRGLMPVPVLVGISDGTNTEILRAGFLVAGMKVVIGEESQTKTAATKSSARLQGGPPGGMPPPM
jgi:HlyD family secretion protein